jgi:hypothetical protein
VTGTIKLKELCCSTPFLSILYLVRAPSSAGDVDVDLRVLFVNVLCLEWEVTNAQFLFVLEQVEELYSLDLDSLGQLRSDLSLALTSLG